MAWEMRYLGFVIAKAFCYTRSGAGQGRREVYERPEKRGREAGFPRWREAGEKGGNNATLRNISQTKNCEEEEPTNTERDPGLKS